MRDLGLDKREAIVDGVILSCVILGCVGLGSVLSGCGAPSRSSSSEGRGRDVEVQVEFADLDRIHVILGESFGRPVFVNFWATWCVPCVEELPDLAALAREDAMKEARFVGISLDAWVTGNGAETEQKVKRALADAGVSYPNLIYRGDQDPLLEGFQMPGPIPYSVLYDGQGKRVEDWAGPATIQEVRRAIASAAAQSASGARG